MGQARGILKGMLLVFCSCEREAPRDKPVDLMELDQVLRQSV
jgi:hypothetical protein